MPVIRSPIVPNFRRRRTSFEVDLAQVMEQDRNGMRQRILIDESSVTEEKYQAWLKRVGGNGVNVGTRPEAAVYLELERLGYRAPESDPPGFDFEFAPLDPILDDIDLWFTNPPTIIRVQGEYFHFADSEAEARDNFQRQQAESRGFIVVDILAQDTLQRGRLEQAVRLAIMGVQIAQDGRLQVFR